jgi:hypothetical protein
MKSNSNIKPPFRLSSTSIFNSNFHSSILYVFNKDIINYENINYEELEKLQNRLKELELLNLKDKYTITERRKNINIRKSEIKKVSK